MASQKGGTPGPAAFLVRHLASALKDATRARPYITLTWAQSLDAKIAGPGGERVLLSGPESMLMTHWMRCMHDAILIGINTLILDDPRLQISQLPEDLPLHSPQPLIIDPQLRFPIASRMLKEWNSSQGMNARIRQPWILCGGGVSRERREAVERAGARVIPVPMADGRLLPTDLPQMLSNLHLRSVMIEGGSAILSAFLHSPSKQDGTPLVDSVIVTVAPMFIGEGIAIVPQGEGKQMPQLETVHTEAMDKDAVMMCKIVAPKVLATAPPRTQSNAPQVPVQLDNRIVDP